MSRSDLRRFSEAVLALHDCASPSHLGQALLRSMQALLDADIHTVKWFGAAGIDDISSHSGKLPMDNALEILNAHLHEHPLLPMVEKTRTAGVSHAMKWSDVVTLRRFRQTALYLRNIGRQRAHRPKTHAAHPGKTRRRNADRRRALRHGDTPNDMTPKSFMPHNPVIQ